LPVLIIEPISLIVGVRTSICQPFRSLLEAKNPIFKLLLSKTIKITISTLIYHTASEYHQLQNVTFITQSGID